MNRILEEIKKLELDGDRHMIDDLFLRLLYKKQQILGENPTQEAAEEGWEQVCAELFQIHETQKRSFMERAGLDEDTEESIRVIKRVLREMEILYRGYLHSFGSYVITFAQGLADCFYQIMICLDAGTKMCQINAVYPSQLNTTQLDSSCADMDEDICCSDHGKLLYHHSFSIRNVLEEADCKAVLLTAIKSVCENYNTVVLSRIEMKSEGVKQTQRLPSLPDQIL